MQPDGKPWLERWLRRPNARPARAVVLGGSANGLSFARSLGRRGVPTLLLDSERYVGTYTRYAVFGQLPPVELQPGAWLEALECAGQRLAEPAALFVTSDAHSDWLADHHERLARYYRFVLSPMETVRQLLDKQQQYTAAAAAGVLLPATFYPASGREARQAGDRLGYPCLFKPCTAHLGRPRLGGQKALVIGSASEMEAAYAGAATRAARFMVQEIIPGGDDAIYWYLTFCDAAGCERAWITGRKLRQYPPGFGNGSISVSVDAPAVAGLSRRLLRLFNCRGYASIEFKRDERDGSLRLIEINPRSDSFNEMGAKAGVDLAWIGYQYLVGDPACPAEPPAFRRGVWCVDEEQDVLAALALRRSGALGWLDWLRSLRGARTIIAAWDDPGPLLAGLGRVPRAFGPRRSPRQAGDA
jgi:predicted ATP-grasp superfamily ATP-dependent carboligase